MLAVASPFLAVGEAVGPNILRPGLIAAALTGTLFALRFAAYSRLEYIKAAMLTKYVPRGAAAMALDPLNAYQPTMGSQR